MKTPILFLIFNRPDQTRRVFAEIKKARPERLFIAADGPRIDRPEDIDKCKRAREIVDEIDWPCEIKTLFQEKNLGCRNAPPTAISWFFDNVEAGIILEDDCLPDPSFFPFCAELLERYAKDERVMQISGDCFQDNNSKFSRANSYFFSTIPYLWGWASWRRAWQQYDPTMVGWPEVRSQETLRKVLTDPAVYSHWEYFLDSYYDRLKDSWDGPWVYACMMHNRLSINPTVNLIENIGFGSEATHTKDAESNLSKMSVSSLHFPLTHTKTMVPDTIADAFAFRHHFGINASLRQRILGPFKSRFPKTYRRIKNLFVGKTKPLITYTIYILNMKEFLKKITPPIVWNVVRSLFLKKKLHPIWNTLDYDPLKEIKLFLDPSGAWQKKMIDGSYDQFLFDRLKGNDLRGKVIYDIGAHIGYHSLYFARLVGSGGRVRSFEPSPKNVERFRTILDKNEEFKDIISIFTKAVSDRIGVEVFNINDNIESGKSTGNFLESADTVWERDVYARKGFTKVQVETVPVDAFKKTLSIQEDPDLIKMDVEGAEYAVLLGAKETLLRKKPVLMIEVHSIANMFNVVTFLNSISYEMELIGKVNQSVCYIEARPKK